MYIKSTLFKKEWEQLEIYYHLGEKGKSPKHTREESNFYYSKLKDLTDEEFILTIKNIYDNCKYFPNIAEIRKQVPTIQDVAISRWNNIQSEPMTKEETKELEEILKKYK